MRREIPVKVTLTDLPVAGGAAVPPRATGVLALLLAMGAVMLVAAVDRSDRTAEIASLRTQDLRHRDAAVYARCGYLWVVAAAVAAGTVAALVAWVAVGPFVPQFSDRVRDGSMYWPPPFAVPAVAAPPPARSRWWRRP